MAYTIQNFNDGIVLTAEHLNHIESGIVANAEEIANIKQNATSTSRIGKVELLLDAWVSHGTTMYKQVVSIDGVTKDSKVDLTPDTFQLKEFSITNIALVAVNDGGSVTVYSVGGKPAGYYMIPVAITEVTTNDSEIVGASVGANVDVNQVLLGTGILSTVNKNAEDISKLSKEIEDLKDNGTSGSGLTTDLKSAMKTYFTDMQTLLTQIAYGTDNNLSITMISNAQAVVTALDSTGEVEPDTPSEPSEPDEPIVPDEPEKTLSSISVSYTGENVSVGTALTDLTGIVVIATYSDASTQVVTGYTLSGEIVEGSNTITVTYEGKTATFTVTGYAVSTDEEWTQTISDVAWTQNATINSAGEADNSSTTKLSDFIEVPSDANAIKYTGFDGVSIAYYDEDKTFIVTTMASYTGTTTYGASCTDGDGIAWMPLTRTAKYIRISVKKTTTETAVTFKHFVELNEIVKPVIGQLYVYVNDKYSNVVYDELAYANCNGMAYVNIRPINRRQIVFYDSNHSVLSTMATANNLGNNVEIPEGACYFRCGTTSYGRMLVKFAETGDLTSW